MWHPPARTAVAEAAVAAAEADRVARPERYRLEVEHLAHVAAQPRVGTRTGANDSGSILRAEGRSDGFSKGWRDGLEMYLGSAAEDGD